MKITTHHSFMFSIFSNILYYVISFPILKLLLKIVYDLKIEGKENIRNIKGAVISVSNHVLPLDCAMVGLAYGAKKVYYTTQEQTFDIPFVRYLVKFLRGIPIPKKIKDKKVFINVINESLKEGKSIHFYPEAEMTLREEKIKPFIHTMPIPGSENDNANYFSSRGMSIKCDSVPEVIDSVKKLLTDKKLQNEMVQNQKKFMKQNTCDKIAELIIKELEK